jgi:8-oxo-dGTP diphosphatase
MVTVDAVVFTVRDARLEVLLIRRGHEPFKGLWALPGGFLDMDEELEAAAARELFEETGVTGIRLEQFHTFGAVHRDPRGRVITVAYVGLADWRVQTIRAADDAAEVSWKPAADLPRLACDHNSVINGAVRRLGIITKAGGEILGPLLEGAPLDELRCAVDACGAAWP